MNRYWEAFKLYFLYRGGTPIMTAAIDLAAKNGVQTAQKGYYSVLYTFEDAQVRVAVQKALKLEGVAAHYLVQIQKALEVPGNWEIVFQGQRFFKDQITLFQSGSWLSHLFRIRKGT